MVGFCLKAHQILSDILDNPIFSHIRAISITKSYIFCFVYFVIVHHLYPESHANPDTDSGKSDIMGLGPLDTY